MMDKEITPTPNSASQARYRGACVEDLQLPPAFCLPSDALLQRAIEAAYEREFDQLPILNERRKPIGYLNIPLLKTKYENGEINQEDLVSQHLTHFPMSSITHPYTVIHPLTSLADLETFFSSKQVEFALVTDLERRWVLAVATRDDLETFVKRRG